MSPFLLWQSAALSRLIVGEAAAEWTAELNPGPGRLSPAAAGEDVPTQAFERRARSLEHESDLAQQPPPIRSREESIGMAIVLDSHPALAIANENREVDEVR